MAGVIKAGRTGGPATRVGGVDLGDFLAEGRQVLAAARAQAERIVADARAEAERMKSGASEAGYEAGYQQGLVKGQADGHEEALERATATFEAQHVQLASACESLFREVDRRKDELLRAAHRDMVTLAVAIAERVVKRIGLLDRHAASANLLAVTELVGEATDLIVEANPVDAETLETFAQDLVAHRSELRHVEVKTNEAVEPGGCIVGTRSGRIDASLDTQLKRIAEELVPDPVGTSTDEDADGEASNASPD